MQMIREGERTKLVDVFEIIVVVSESLQGCIIRNMCDVAFGIV